MTYHTAFKVFHPFVFVGSLLPKKDTDYSPSDDLHKYGFELDLTTECYFYTYDWGYGFNFRIFGFGVEIARYRF
jgi:hypothetical protein